MDWVVATQWMRGWKGSLPLIGALLAATSLALRTASGDLHKRGAQVLQDAAAGKPGERIRHRRWQREMKDREVASPRPGILERHDFILQVVVHRQRVQIGAMAHPANEIAQAQGALADGVTAVRRRDPLVDDHGASGNALYTDGRYCRSSSSCSA